MSKVQTDVIVYDVPARGSITVSLDPATWPMKTNDVGWVPHWAVVPDPDQPRLKEDIDEKELLTLGESIKEVGQLELVKVRLLTAAERIKYTHGDGRIPWYLLVSGHCRHLTMSPERFNIPIIELRVASYESDADQFLDAFIINEHHQSLSAWSIAKSLERILREKCNGVIRELRRVTRKSPAYIDSYLDIGKLIPEARRYLDPKLPRRESLSIDLAAMLGRQSHEKQRKYLGPLLDPNIGGKSAVQRMRWLTDQLTRDTGGIVQGSRADRPIDTLQRMLRLIDSGRANASVLLSTGDEAFASAFRFMDRTECQSLVDQLATLGELFEKVRVRTTQFTAGKLAGTDQTQNLLPGWRVVNYYDRGRKSNPILNHQVSPQGYERLKKLGWLMDDTSAKVLKEADGASESPNGTAQVQGLAKSSESPAGQSSASSSSTSSGRLDALPPPRPLEEDTVDRMVRSTPGSPQGRPNGRPQSRPLDMLGPSTRRAEPVQPAASKMNGNGNRQPVRRVVVPEPVARATVVRDWPRVRPLEEPKTMWSSSALAEKRLTVSVFDTHAGRITSRVVNPAEYVELWDGGLLIFQEGWKGVGAKPKPKPDHYWTREEANSMIPASAE